MLASLGFIVTILFWVAGAYLLRTWRGTNKMSISQHAASAKGATLLFTTTLIFLGATFYYWLIAWFVPHLQLGTMFVVTLTVMIVLLCIAAVVPDSQGWKRIVHRLAAYGMALLFIPLTYQILGSSQLSDAARFVGYAGLVYMIFAGLTAIFSKKAWDYYLLFQSLYIVAFQLVILVAAYM